MIEDDQTATGARFGRGLAAAEHALGSTIGVGEPIATEQIATDAWE